MEFLLAFPLSNDIVIVNTVTTILKVMMILLHLLLSLYRYDKDYYPND